MEVDKQEEYLIIGEPVLNLRNGHVMLSTPNYEAVRQILEQATIIVILIIETTSTLYGVGHFKFATKTEGNQFKFRSGAIINKSFDYLRSKATSSQAVTYLDLILERKEEIQEDELAYFIRLVLDSSQFKYKSTQIELKGTPFKKAPPKPQRIREYKPIIVEKPIIIVQKPIEEKKIENSQLLVQKKSVPIQNTKKFLQKNKEQAQKLVQNPINYVKQTTNQFVFIDSPIVNEINVKELAESDTDFKALEQASKNIQIYKRILRQIKAVNDDFFNLRTKVYPDPQGKINILYYYMFPNDGAFCSLPLIGRIIISETYPQNPPVFHLFTRTNRMNLDVYNSYINNLNQSSICFDIVKPINNPQTRWKSDYTLSTVFASIMQVIVSINVDQMYGGVVTEYVTMQKLDSCYKNAKNQFIKRKDILRKIPQIPAISAAQIKCKALDFHDFYGSQYVFATGTRIIRSRSIKLQSNEYYTTQFKLRDLAPEFVVSFILTNNPGDIKAEQNDTVVFRNGVTATAAKKLYGEKIAWYYHGKPFNRSTISLNLTITPKQFCISYNDEFSKQWLIHGDTPVAVLKEDVVGDLTHDDFYLLIFVRNKENKKGNSFTLQKSRTSIGFIHLNTEYL